ncbi:MAG: hypothetical protein HYZ53_11625 [Planctomycetes bacterium]|nr:hypothetical protein [Planctomycetota bacterium]
MADMKKSNLRGWPAIRKLAHLVALVAAFALLGPQACRCGCPCGGSLPCGSGPDATFTAQSAPGNGIASAAADAVAAAHACCHVAQATSGTSIHQPDHDCACPPVGSPTLLAPAPALAAAPGGVHGPRPGLCGAPAFDSPMTLAGELALAARDPAPAESPPTSTPALHPILRI